MAQDLPLFRDKNPFEVLGLQGTEDLPAIRKAFLRVAAQSHPDRLRLKSEEEKAQALETFLLAKKAFEVLSQPDKRREWSEKLAPPPVTPPPEARKALTPPPGAPPRETPSSSALLFYQQGMRALASSDYAKALDFFARAAKLSPTPRNQAMEEVCRGHQYLSTRFFDRARDSFDRALQLQPDCREARAGLDALAKLPSKYFTERKSR